MAMSAVRWPYPVLASWLEQQNINDTFKSSANIIAPTLAKMQTTGVMSHTVSNKSPVSFSSSFAGRRVAGQRTPFSAARLQSKGSNTVVARQAREKKSHLGRWKGLDEDVSDDQQDITRGRGMVDSLYQAGGGAGGTHNAVLSSEDYMKQSARNLNNIEDGFYISPAFLDKITVHIAKNFLELPKIKVPLILGIWGGKGQGKTFQCTLAYKKLGINPVVMSAGELESGNAGEPAKLIRQRYREASDIIKKGKMCSLFINDLDAVYKQETIPRVPIVCTGNDFSTLYAPLIRDGRMEKFYWAPTREDRVGVSMGIFKEDGVTRGEVEQIVDTFPGQSIDFFGALRARVYDDKVRDFVKNIGMENIGSRLINSKDGRVEFEKPDMTVDALIEYGRCVVDEQENVQRVQLAESYLSGAELAGIDGKSIPDELVQRIKERKQTAEEKEQQAAGGLLG
ncbi:hypothetical protein WJX79_011116 [Trebouxia sp. C0005]